MVHEVFTKRINKTSQYLQKTDAKTGELRLSRRSVYKLAVDFNECSQLLLPNQTMSWVKD
jgi:hypothetical protein